MNIKEIVIDWLKKNGYTGLCDPIFECGGCTLKNLICDNIKVTSCKAGYEHSNESVYLKPQEIPYYTQGNKK